jgi:hypothetical protein
MWTQSDTDFLKSKKKLMIKYGFLKPKYLSRFAGKSPEQMDKLIAGMSSDEINAYADMEKAEYGYQIFIETGYPNSLVRNHLVFENDRDPVEDVYFFEKDMIRVDFHFPYFHKIIDVFAASQQSSMWGVSEQRLGLQQDKVSQYLRGISEMIKGMFQIVRELRIIDERLSYYEDIEKDTTKSLASEITLKGIFIDQVEGGAKNPSSVYGLANTVGFAVLPDFFFRTQVKDINKLDAQIEKIHVNEKLKEVLKRKLIQFYKWQEHTKKELTSRRNFTIKYLRQHYDTVKLYISWIKPYLRNIERLQHDQKKQDSVDMVSSFEGAMSEIEFLATKPVKDKSVHSCLLLNFLFRTRPSMAYQAEGYQRGPSHVGRVEVTYRAYAWTPQQIANYLKMSEEENMAMLTAIDSSLTEAMDSLGDELFEYLKEAGEKFGKAGEAKPSKDTMMGKLGKTLEPFSYIWKGFTELVGATGLSGSLSVEGAQGKPLSKGLQKVAARKAAEADAKGWVWMAYKNYKKARKMITW